jgi:hypothetical protein
MVMRHSAGLWDEYIERNPEGYRYSRFCELHRAWEARLSVTMRQTDVGGDKLFVDYVGDTVPVIVDRLTGEVRQAHIFVAVMGASNFTYAESEDEPACVSTVNLGRPPFLAGPPPKPGAKGALRKPGIGGSKSRRGHSGAPIAAYLVAFPVTLAPAKSFQRSGPRTPASPEALRARGRQGRSPRAWHLRRCSTATEGDSPMSQRHHFDTRRSLTALEQDSTIIAVIEMSQSKWLVAGLVPGVEREPLKKLDANEEALLKLSQSGDYIPGWIECRKSAGRRGD